MDQNINNARQLLSPQLSQSNITSYNNTPVPEIATLYSPTRKVPKITSLDELISIPFSTQKSPLSPTAKSSQPQVQSRVQPQVQPQVQSQVQSRVQSQVQSQPHASMQQPQVQSRVQPRASLQQPLPQNININSLIRTSQKDMNLKTVILSPDQTGGSSYNLLIPYVRMDTGESLPIGAVPAIIVPIDIGTISGLENNINRSNNIVPYIPTENNNITPQSQINYSSNRIIPKIPQIN